jgi:polar amino acid transport system substrate-binding protein
MPTPRSTVRFCLSLVALIGVVLLPAAAQAQETPNEPAVVIPNFWDPQAERTPAPAIDGIRFTTADDYPPFNFTDADGRLVGFNVDLARAICEQLGIPCTIQVRPFEDLVGALADDRADAAIAGIAISAETRQSVAFSDVYLRLPARFVERRGLPFDISVAALAGRRVAVVEGTAHEAYLRAFFPDADIRAYADAETARAALRQGEVDALFGDGLQLSFWLEGIDAGGCCLFAGGPYLDPAFFGEGFAVAVKPDEPDILAAINAALRAINANGTYAGIYLRYFPLSFF